ncbi:PREDICTED: histidine ammonia-lyase-like [Amphimedon queenslandica]|uniref:Histidine ammonia-lyase n=1 Tax=Amphimedon queenslandica TaxID=400682 RepID=A0A1X7VS79_AMPQE|nr:PREDICTED: histidine ammonia-lyase-like [Amphimedon queenslandica]|eukprot:XP_011405902.1 PREDICTED: histidine ammonia-lyase-like [Amphimedon queenslandica]
MSSSGSSSHVGDDSIYFVTVQSERRGEGGEKRPTLSLPVPFDDRTVADLVPELLKELEIMEGDRGSCNPSPSTYELRHYSEEGGEETLRPDSKAKDVIQNLDRLTLCPKKTNPRPDPYKKSIYNSMQQEQQLKLQQHFDKVLSLDGYSLSIEDLIQIGLGKYRVQLSEEAIYRVKKAREVVDRIVEGDKGVYGINTGFGRFASVPISRENVSKLQENLIRSHATCLGEPLSLMRTRLLLALRINVLAKGCSGIRLETLQQLVNALNASCLSSVPEKGTVGASGDLAPLSHLALGLMGEGEMWGPKTDWGDAKEVLNAHGLEPIHLEAKEGIALINGTQFISALGSEAYFRSKRVADQADVIAALSIDVLKGTPRAFDQDIHLLRPHQGQLLVASRLRSLLDSNVHPSEIRESHRDCNRIQDPYTMRCVPQVHGIVHDTLDFVSRILSTEINSATDNPIILANRAETISGGNFHGEYPAKVLDYLAIGVHEIANMSERRLERMVHPGYSDLPGFLAKDGGLNSGFMLAHVTAAALVSENKVLTHPSSVDSITTSGGTEDHVSMGGFAARKALSVVSHVEQVVAIELMAACQALDFHRPKKTTDPLEEVYKLVRSVVKTMDTDRFMAPDIAAVTNLIQEGKVWDVVSPYIVAYEEALHSGHTFTANK